MKLVPVYLSEEELSLLRRGLSAIHPLAYKEVDKDELKTWAKLLDKLEEELATFNEG